jgi:ABC-2 type transport system permease protein
MMVLSLIFPLLLVSVTNPEVAPIFTGFLAVLLCALAFASIGMAVSSFTENQIVAGVSSMVTLLLLYVIQAPSESLGGTAGEVLKYLCPIEQVQDLVKGVITLQSVVYFISLTVLGLFLSQRALDSFRWR